MSKRTSSSLDDLLPGLPVARAENERWLEKLRDPILKKAFELREKAWQTAFSRSGEAAVARDLITQAAQLDPEFLEQVAGLENYLARRARAGKVSLPRAINQKITPFLVGHGFAILSMWKPDAPTSRSWRQDLDFCRVIGQVQQAISLGSGKFGRQLSLMVSISGAPGGASHRDHRDFGVSHVELEYVNQSELELVVDRVCELLSTQVLPWLDRARPGV